jgi:hypothetical protein
MSIHDEHDPDEILMDLFDKPLIEEAPDGEEDHEIEEKEQILLDLFDDERGEGNEEINFWHI